MLKPRPKNSYQEFLRKKKKFAEKRKQGKIFKDTDGDGLSDYEEKYLYGTDPKNPDTDRDGLKDGDEVKRGRNPLGPGRLKDLFIPHAGNNYLPQALQPKRLLCHAVSLVAIKTVVVVFVLFYPLAAWLSPDLALAQAKKIIELTNNLRQAVSLPALLESQKLTQAAWQKAEDMALNQYFAHTSPAGLSLKNWLEKIGYKYALAGENLAVGFTRPDDVVLAWKNSPTHYGNIIDRYFKEIGVAMADGRFDQVDTVFIAQYFGAPAMAAAEEPVKETAKEKPVAPASPPTQPVAKQPATQTEIQGEKVTVKPGPATVIKPMATTTSAALSQALVEPETVAENKILIDQQATVLTIKKDQLSQTSALQIETILPADTVSAEVIINNHKITLGTMTGEINRWSGAALINREEEKNILNPLIPAAITVINSAGVTKYGELDWDKITIIKTTPLEHYQLYKNHPAAAMAPIMNLSGLYFKLILTIAIMALLLNIFIEIRKQHPHIIFYSFAFLGLLVAIIIF